MRTTKNLLPISRQIFHTELLCCPHCGGELKLCNYLTWDKTVQTLGGVLSIASRPSHCILPDCTGYVQRFVSASGQQIALPGSTYGLDVVVRIGWLRQEGRYTFGEIQQQLAPIVQISESHLRHTYQRVYLPLLACHEREHKDKLDEIVKKEGGLIITLDGLVPEGGQPQIWFMRDLSTGLTLRSGWIGTFDTKTFVDFLLPLKTLEWPILAVLSDKQKGLLPAVAEVLPNTPHQLCQPHFLRNLAEPLSTADSSFKVSLRKSVRDEVGELIRSERVINNSQSRLLTMTGLFPDNEGHQSAENKSKEANEQNNSNKSEACDTQVSTETVTGGLQNKKARSDQEIQKQTVRTNKPDKDSKLLEGRTSEPQIIKEASTIFPRTSNDSDSSVLSVEISKNTNINKKNDPLLDTGAAYDEQPANSQEIEQTTSHLPNVGSEAKIPGRSEEISSQPESDTPPAPTKTTINEPLGTVVSILPDVADCQQAANTGEVEQASENLQTYGSELESPPLSSCHLLPNTPSPITDPKNPPLAAARFDASNDARNEAAGHSPPIIKTSAASSTSTIDSQATNDSQLANQVIMQIMRHVRYLLTLKGRPPLRLVGIFMYQRLLSVCKLLDDLLAHRYDYYLNSLREGLKTALAPYSEQFNELKLASTWMDEISNILSPVETGSRSSEEVANQLRDYLNQRLSSNHDNPFLTNFAQHLDNISTNYWPGLFHTYDCEFLPRTNNEIESHFRDTQRRLLRTTGQKGQTKRTLHRYGAWELLPRPPTEAERLEGFLQVSREALKIEQNRLAEHLQRFSMDTRSPKLLDSKFNNLRRDWFKLPPDTTG